MLRENGHTHTVAPELRWRDTDDVLSLPFSDSQASSAQAAVELHKGRFDHEHRHNDHDQGHDPMNGPPKRKRSPNARTSASKITNLDPNSTSQALKKRMNFAKPPGLALK
jgi:hypothetical protein